MKRQIKNIFFTGWLLFIGTFYGYCEVQPPDDILLKFRTDHTFRIVQFTDIHWNQNLPDECSKTINLLEMVIEAEKPDFVVLTGDIVTVSPARDGWMTIAGVLEKSGLPWSVVLGNHDDETDLNRDEIFELLETLPGFKGEKGPVSGVGNYVLPISSSSSNETLALLYFLDSHAYTTIPDAGHYDWFRFDQVQWYRSKSEDWKLKTGKDKLPALSFFHIPTPEWQDVVEMPGTLGEKNEDVACGIINPGMVASFLEMGDVMGAFVGHDHVNNYIGNYHGVALAYGQKTGFNSYGDLPKGARVIELHEGRRSFKTWVRTSDGEDLHYQYPLGVSFLEKDHIFLPDTKLENPASGLNFAFFEGYFQSVPELLESDPSETGIITEIKIPDEKETDHFGYLFSGYIKIEKKGLYRFYLKSDDGSVLWIDDRQLINNDGMHSIQKKDALIALDSGFHKLKLVYFDSTENQHLELNWMGPDFDETSVSGSKFFHIKVESD